jgi:hypothetical protein
MLNYNGFVVSVVIRRAFSPAVYKKLEPCIDAEFQSVKIKCG